MTTAVSVQRRAARRRARAARRRARAARRYAVPTFHPAEERWMRWALGDHVCVVIPVRLP